MKKYFFPVVAVSFFAMRAAPADLARQTLPVKPAEELAKKTCPIPVWDRTVVYWKGVEDQRTEKAIGHQIKKGEVIAEVFSEPALEQVFDAHLRSLLEACGLKFAKTGQAAHHSLAVSIAVFRVGTQKKLLAQKTESEGRIAVDIGGGGTVLSIELSQTIKRKGMRTMKLRQIEKTASELLTGLLEQVPAKLGPHLR